MSQSAESDSSSRTRIFAWRAALVMPARIPPIAGCSNQRRLVPTAITAIWFGRAPEARGPIFGPRRTVGSEYPSRCIAAWTRSAVSARTLPGAFNTRETVAVETSAILATSTIDIVGLVVVVWLPDSTLRSDVDPIGAQVYLLANVGQRRSFTNLHVEFAR